jgi:hypothetical protein
MHPAWRDYRDRGRGGAEISHIPEHPVPVQHEAPPRPALYRGVLVVLVFAIK